MSSICKLHPILKTIHQNGFWQYKHLFKLFEPNTISKLSQLHQYNLLLNTRAMIYPKIFISLLVSIPKEDLRLFKNLKYLLRLINLLNYLNSNQTSFYLRFSLKSEVFTIKKPQSWFHHLIHASYLFRSQINLKLRYLFQKEQQLHQFQYQQYSHQSLHRNCDLQNHQVLLVENLYLLFILLLHYFEVVNSKKVY